MKSVVHILLLALALALTVMALWFAREIPRDVARVHISLLTRCSIHHLPCHMVDTSVRIPNRYSAFLGYLN